VNENPTDGDQGYVAPDVSPPVEPAEPVETPPGALEPPLLESAEQAPPGATPVTPGEAAPSKQRLNIGFFILGFVTPWLATAIVSVPLGALTGSFPALGVVGGALPLAVIAAQLAAWLIGRSNGNNRLRSWGLGGVISVAVQVLAAMLFFGACLLNIGGLQNQLGG
jgi:hypothetical protein